MQAIFSVTRVKLPRVFLTWFFSHSSMRADSRSGHRIANQFDRTPTFSATQWPHRLAVVALLGLLVLLTGCGTGRSGSAPQQLDLGAGYTELKDSPLSAARNPPIAVPAGSAASLPPLRSPGQHSCAADSSPSSPIGSRPPQDNAQRSRSPTPLFPSAHRPA